jgi:hypothetical protein
MSFIRPLCFAVLFFLSSVVAQTPAKPPSQTPSKATASVKQDTHLSPAEADELFRSMDDIMKFASDDTGLPIKSPIKRELGSRDQVVQYIQQKMEEDPDTKRFERTEIVLKKFGMLPLDFQLKPFLLKLLREQVAGFYDSKTKTMHLLDWLPAEVQRPVMAHELTHALQDQTVDLEKWTSERTEAAEKAADPVNAEIENDEDSTARSAVVEGQGTAVMIDYILMPMGKSLETSPELGEVMKNAMDSPEGEGMEVLASAPVLLRETLTFPYRDGLGFVQALLKTGSKKKAFMGALLDPPHDTHQILHPQDYLDHKPTPVMHMPDLNAALGNNYAKYDVGSMGELDLAILFKQFNDESSAKQLAPQWHGGMYFAAMKRKDKNGKRADEPASPSGIAILYVSDWKSPEVAREFAAAYGKTVAKRYVGYVRKDCAGLSDCSTWNISGGDPVIVQTMGNRVFVSESFDQKTADALRKLFAGPASAGKSTDIHAGNLSVRVAAPYFAATRQVIH